MESPEVPKESKVNYWHENIMRPAIVEYQKTGSEDLYTSVLHQPFCHLCQKWYWVEPLDKEDASQECVLHLLSKVKYFNAKKSIKTLSWFGLIAKRFFINRHRSKVARLNRQILAPDYEDTIYPFFESTKLAEFLEFFEDPANVAKVCGMRKSRRHKSIAEILDALKKGECKNIREVAAKSIFCESTVFITAHRMVKVFKEQSV